MQYIWSHHALHERLEERSGLLQTEVEAALDERKYVVQRRQEEHHLIWDHVRQHLIDVPTVYDSEDAAVIPTILPVTYGSGYAEWQRAEAERAWRGEKFYAPIQSRGTQLETVQVKLGKRWIKPSGWSEHQELIPLIKWPVYDAAIARTGDEGVVSLLRDYRFCSSVRTLLQKWEKQIPFFIGKDTPIVIIKKPGAHRIVPI